MAVWSTDTEPASNAAVFGFNFRERPLWPKGAAPSVKEKGKDRERAPTSIAIFRHGPGKFPLDTIRQRMARNDSDAQKYSDAATRTFGLHIARPDYH